MVHLSSNCNPTRAVQSRPMDNGYFILFLSDSSTGDTSDSVHFHRFWKHVRLGRHWFVRDGEKDPDELLYPQLSNCR